MLSFKSVFAISGLIALICAVYCCFTSEHSMYGAQDAAYNIGYKIGRAAKIQVNKVEFDTWLSERSTAENRANTLLKIESSDWNTDGLHSMCEHYLPYACDGASEKDEIKKNSAPSSTHWELSIAQFCEKATLHCAKVTPPKQKQ